MSKARKPLLKRPRLARPGRRQWLRAGVLMSASAPFVLAGCATTASNHIPPPTGFIPVPTVHSGESWRYALINRYNNEVINEVNARVATVEPELRIELVDSAGKSMPDEIYDGAWKILQEPIYNETLVFDESVPLLPSQLAVGARHTANTRYRLSGKGRQYSWQVQLHATNWERIQVPAGTFDTLRIERHIGFEHHDLFRRGSRRIDTLWYAPAVNRWVMREWTGYYLEDGAHPFSFEFGLSSWHGFHHYSQLSLRNRSMIRSGFAPGFYEEGEDAIRWVLLEHQHAPVA